MGDSRITDVVPADPMVDAVFDVRTGYHVITKPAGWFEKHPDGEGNPLLFSIIRCKHSQLVDFHRWDGREEQFEDLSGDRVKIVTPWDDTPDVIVPKRQEGQRLRVPAISPLLLPIKKLDLMAHVATREQFRHKGSKLKNVFKREALLTEPGSLEDFIVERVRIDTWQNAILTVGTGKTHATISAAVAAGSSGDVIEVYATSGNTYTETVLSATNWYHIIGLVVSQGLTITNSSGNQVVQFGGNSNAAGNVLENFTIDATGTVLRCLHSSKSSIARINMTGGTQGGHFASNRTVAVNCIAQNTGGYGVQSAASGGNVFFFYTAADCAAVGMDNSGVADIFPVLCLSSGNIGADYDNFGAGQAGALNVSEDGTAPGTGAVTSFVDADLDGTYRLLPGVAATTLARRIAYPPIGLVRDIDELTRKQTGIAFAGASDPDPATFGTIVSESQVGTTKIKSGVR